jgi:hypothetical protein
MAIGCIEGSGAEGMLEGWATDPAQPLAGLAVAILDSERREVATGFAHLYRTDLAATGIGLGWCAFRLIAVRPLNPQGEELTLVERRSQEVLFGPQLIAPKPNQLKALSTIADVVDNDPTVLVSIDQLKPCRAVFDDFLARQGATAFIRLAHVYLLQRVIDASSLAYYENLLGQADAEPFSVLKSMAESDEFRSRRRNLSAPTAPGFPFRIA